MELALAEEPIPEPLIHKVLREATVHLQIQPVLCGSALHGMGVQPMLDAVAAYLPNPTDVPPVEGIDLKHKGKGKSAEATTANAKKIAASPTRPSRSAAWCSRSSRTRRATWPGCGFTRARSKPNSPRAQSRQGQEGKRRPALAHPRQSRRTSSSNRRRAGDIVGVIGLRDSITGDTLCDTREPILLASIEFPETVISMAIEPESTDDRKKLAETLDMLRKQDPTFRAAENPETGQTLISGMGELHLEVIQHRLLRDFKLNVKVHKPRVSYRETIARAAEVDRRVQPHDPGRAARGQGADPRRAVRQGRSSR